MGVPAPLRSAVGSSAIPLFAPASSATPAVAAFGVAPLPNAINNVQNSFFMFIKIENIECSPVKNFSFKL
jgi:hypothetical protein